MALTQISTAGVKDDAVTSGKIPANAVGSSELADNAVDTAAIADDAVTAAKIADGTVTAAQMADNSSPTRTIQNSAVTTIKIADNAVTAGKLASGVQTTINNNADNRVITGSGTANTLNGESGLTFDGDTAAITRSGNSAGGLSITNTNNTQASAHARLELSGGDNASAIMRMECNGHANEFIADGSGNLRVDDNGTERMRIDSSGKVGIGETAPLAQLHIKPASNSTQLYLEQNNAAHGYSLFVDGPNGGHLKFMRHIDGSETQKALLRSDGGLCFGTDSAAANALDDYEEGTWTPHILNGWGILNPTYDEQVGLYVKIGKLVHIFLRIDLSGGSTNGNRIAISNFPFTPATIGSTGYVALNGYCDVASSNAQNIFCMVGRSGTTAEVFHRESTGESSFTGTELGNTGQMNFSGTFTTT